MKPPRPAFADDLAASLQEAFRLLANAVPDRRSPLHTPTVATLDESGAPSLRTVVLRGFDADARRPCDHGGNAREREFGERAAIGGFFALAL